MRSENSDCDKVLASRWPWDTKEDDKFMWTACNCWLKSQAPSSKTGTSYRSSWTCRLRDRPNVHGSVLTNPVSGVDPCSWQRSSGTIHQRHWEPVRKTESQAQPRPQNQNLHFNMFRRSLGCTVISEKHGWEVLLFLFHLKQWHNFAKLNPDEEIALHTTTYLQINIVHLSLSSPNVPYLALRRFAESLWRPCS